MNFLLGDFFMKFFYTICFLFMMNCCIATAADVQSTPIDYPQDFQEALDTLFYGLERGEGVVDNVLLVDFRKHNADEYYDLVIDRLNQMQKIDKQLTKDVLKDLTLTYIHSDKHLSVAPHTKREPTETANTSMDDFLPFFEKVKYIDSTLQYQELLFAQNRSTEVKYLITFLGENFARGPFDSEELGLNNVTIYTWTK